MATVAASISVAAITTAATCALAVRAGMPIAEMGATSESTCATA